MIIDVLKKWCLSIINVVVLLYVISMMLMNAACYRNIDKTTAKIFPFVNVLSCDASSAIFLIINLSNCIFIYD